MNDAKRGTERCRCWDVQSGWAKNHLEMAPGNAILLNGVGQTANREIGVPGLQPPRLVPSTNCYLFTLQSLSDRRPIVLIV